MPKKTLVRIEEGATATSVAYGSAALLDAGLAEWVGAGSAAEEGLDCGGRLSVRVARRLEQLRQQLEAAAEQVARISDELRRWRRQRDRANTQLYDKTKMLRGFCRGIFEGDQGDEFLGLRGTLPREPKELHAACGSMARRLADAEWPMPDFEVAGLAIDRERVVRSLVKAYGQLGEALASIKDGETREALAKVAKKRAVLAHNSFLDKSTRYLEAALELAGLEDVAATVRPGIGRRGRSLHQLAGLPEERQMLPATTSEPPVARLLPDTELAAGEEASPAEEPDDDA